MPSHKPCKNSNRPLCKFFYDKKCRRGDKCRFYHPLAITPAITKERNRKSGICYCGSHLKTVVRRIRMVSEDDKTPLFIVVCGKTGRSIKRCK